MATVTLMVDDLDGTFESADTEVSTVLFAIDTIEYEIDLTTGHADELRDALSKYIEKARVRQRRPIGSRPKASGVDNKAVRAWCAEHGIKVSPVGRIPDLIVQSYLKGEVADELPRVEATPAGTESDEAPADVVEAQPEEASPEDEEKAAALHWWNVTMNRKHQDEANPMLLGQYRKWVKEQDEASAQA